MMKKVLKGDSQFAYYGQIISLATILCHLASYLRANSYLSHLESNWSPKERVRECSDDTLWTARWNRFRPMDNVRERRRMRYTPRGHLLDVVVRARFVADTVRGY